MRDYAEQIDSIRRCAESDDPVYECCFEDCNQHHGRRDNMCRQKIMMDAADAIEELQAAAPKWISVEERLPKFGERVLVSNGGFVCESFLSQSGRWQRGGVDMFFMTPTHWCEMPESPKEENKR